MNPSQLRPWWMRKRFLLPLLFLLGATAALVVAVLRSDTSRIIFYNETGAAIPALKATACGQEIVLRNLTEEESLRWKLAGTGVPGEIALEMAADPNWHWRGGFIKPRGGYRVIIRLWPNGEVEAQTQISIWQQLLHGE